jgi:Ring finger domain
MEASTNVPETTHRDVFVKDTRNLLSAGRRLRERNTSICFWNVSKEFRLLLRNVQYDQNDDLAFELVIVDDERNEEDDSDDEDCQLSRVLELEYDGSFDPEDPEYFIIENLSFSSHDPEDPRLSEAMHKINDAYRTQFCHCGDYFLRPGDELCYSCELRASEADLSKMECPICHAESARLHMRTLACCKQLMHHRCIDKWIKMKEYKGETANCPMCRCDM